MRSNQPQADMIFLPNLDDNQQIKHYKQVIPVTVHHFYIIDEIGDSANYMDLINTLKTAEQHDTIFIYLNTPGGSLHTSIQIISAMRQSSAAVVTCLEGEVCSAGTLIFLSGDKHIVNPHCTFMIHNYSHWVGGKGNEISIRVKHYEEYFRKLSGDIYKDFLTEAELEEVRSGKDFWMDSEEVIRRLNVSDEENNIAAILESAMIIDRSPSNQAIDVADEEEPPTKVVKDRRRKKEGA